MSILVRHNKMQVDQPPHFVSVHGWTNSYAITYTGVLHVYSVVLIDDIYIRTSFEILAKFVQECTSRSRRCCTGMDTATPASSSLEQDMSTLKTKTRPHDAYWWKNSIKLRTTFQLGVGRNWDLWIYNFLKKMGLEKIYLCWISLSVPSMTVSITQNRILSCTITQSGACRTLSKKRTCKGYIICENVSQTEPRERAMTSLCTILFMM
jgi:hypothetical protein